MVVAQIWGRMSYLNDLLILLDPAKLIISTDVYNECLKLIKLQADWNDDKCTDVVKHVKSAIDIMRNELGIDQLSQDIMDTTNPNILRYLLGKK